MNVYLLIRFAHFLGIFCVAGVLMAELMLIRRVLSRKEIQRLARIDALYGIGAVIILGAGLSMWLAVGKPATFYSQNWIFHTKLTLFVLVGILSIWPTVFFIKNRKGPDEEEVRVPFYVRFLMVIEVILLAIIPLLAVLMATGVGAY